MTHALLAPPSRVRRERRTVLKARPPALFELPPPARTVVPSRTKPAPRLNLIRQVRSQISLGRYDTDSRLSIAVSLMIERTV